MDLIIGLVAIILVAYYIVKGYSATGVLMFGGLVLLLISVLMGHSILPENVKSTGSAYFDILEYVKYLLSNRSGGLGLMIMILCGFSAYMTHLGANDMVVKIVSMPLKNIRSPYVLMVLAYFLACLMSFAVASATGLGVLLMATLFPVMVNMGISRGAAAAICASPISIIKRIRLFYQLASVHCGDFWHWCGSFLLATLFGSQRKSECKTGRYVRNQNRCTDLLCHFAIITDHRCNPV